MGISSWVKGFLIVVTEYEALINGLRIAIELGIHCLEIRGDSELVFNQVMMEKICIDPKMAA
jgi:ribonuclease HI